ncbi:MAG: hypothetical protein ABI877_00145 [Gemmatimonadaceae bacterium]
MRTRAELLAEYVRISALLPKAEAELMRYEGVGSVAVGVKETANNPTEEIVFRVYVAEKKAPDQLRPGAMIPTSVLGVRTDVIPPRTPIKSEDADRYRPLMGGVRICNDSSSAFGTLGCFAQRNGGDHSIVMLSCHHVMMARSATIGEPIGQPNVSCCCCCKGDVVAEVVDASDTVLVDCAIARLTKEGNFTNEIDEIGPIFGAAPLNAGGSTVLPTDKVFKRGRSTGYSEGIVVAASMTPPGGAKNHQIEIIPRGPKFKRFANRGDSGSVVVNENNAVVGLLWAIDAETEKLGFANIITNVTTAMDITILNSGTAGTIPLGSTQFTETETRTDGAAMPTDAIVKELEQTEVGRRILAMFDRHGHEINELINTNRQVKVAWNRYQGPSFTAHIIKSANEPGYRIPAEINGVSLTNLVIRISVVLQGQGSAGVAAAVEENTLLVLNLLGDNASIGEVFDKIRAADADRTTGTIAHA